MKLPLNACCENGKLMEHPDEYFSEVVDRHFLIERLGSRNKQESDEAERQIRELGKEGVQLLLKAFQKGYLDSSSRNTISISRAMLLSVIFLPICWLLGALFQGFKLWMVPLGPFFVFTLTWGIRSTYTREQRRIIKMLAESEDICAVVPLINALSYPENSASRIRAVHVALIRLLPTLQSSDLAMLTAENQKELIQFLIQASSQHMRYEHQNELVIVILKILEKYGDITILPIVKNLASGKGTAAKNIHVQKAAQECLPFLQARSEGRTNNILLRPASNPAAQPEMLLRPASATLEAHPEQLLRADSSERGINACQVKKS